jgi:hypothetical protein
MADDAAAPPGELSEPNKPRGGTDNGSAESPDVEVDSVMVGCDPAKASRRGRPTPSDYQGKDVTAEPAAAEGDTAENAEDDHAEGDDPGCPRFVSAALRRRHELRCTHTRAQRNSVIALIGITVVAAGGALLGCAPPAKADAAAYLVNVTVRPGYNFANADQAHRNPTERILPD